MSINYNMLLSITSVPLGFRFRSVWPETDPYSMSTELCHINDSVWC